jgi:hypothetical protein
MEKHTNGSASRPYEDPTSVWCAIDCCFGDESERSLEAVRAAVAPLVCLQECLAAFRGCVKNYSTLKRTVASEEEQASPRGAREWRSLAMVISRRHRRDLSIALPPIRPEP